MTEPLVEELVPAPDPEAVFLRLAHCPHCLFLDSAMTDDRVGRYSFVTADPFALIRAMPDDPDALAPLERLLNDHRTTHRDDLPSFQGGAAGLFSYDLGRQFERLPTPRFDEFGMPALAVGFYDVVVAFDHVAGRAWIISQGLPETNPCARTARAAARLAQFRDVLKKGSELFSPPRSAKADSKVSCDRLVLQHPVPSRGSLTSNFAETGFLRTVERAIEYVFAGDVFQVNLAQRLLHPATDDPVSLYRRLRAVNPAPFAGYFDLGDFQVVSASPERFLRVEDGMVETRPIKGTRPRSDDESTDRTACDELLASVKDRAENTMIVDLLRNDLSRVCQIDSVRVADLCRLESYRYVHHLVSVVEGRLEENRTPLDLLRAAFPGGSITGAPKVRAMEIIAELEPTARGPYCGSLGYVGFDGRTDLSILIRTITAGRGWWQAPVGGGIVAQSDPRREYDETWHKAEGLVQAMCRSR
jgi:para-aminobenzoate synthetase component 1